MGKVPTGFLLFIYYLFLITKSWYFKQGCVDFLDPQCNINSPSTLLGVFLAHFGPFITNRSSLECQQPIWVLLPSMFPPTLYLVCTAKLNAALDQHSENTVNKTLRSGHVKTWSWTASSHAVTTYNIFHSLWSVLGHKFYFNLGHRNIYLTLKTMQRILLDLE